MTPGRVVLLTVAALTGFAANSLLCRAALEGGRIDPAGFTLVRLASGAVVLSTLARLTPRSPIREGSWKGAIALAAYAIAFSLAYVRLTTGTGALILFGFVQLTMMVSGLARGERPRALEWAGLLLALAGLAALVAPGVTAPDPLAALSMATGGIAWGAYTLLGRRATRPLLATAGNFARAVPLGAAAAGIAFASGALHATPTGFALAASSGALASGLGYSVWYAALPSLTTTRAAVVQLSVPVLAAMGGIAFLGESATARLGACGAVVIGGIALAILGRSTR